MSHFFFFLLDLRGGLEEEDPEERDPEEPESEDEELEE